MKRKVNKINNDGTTEEFDMMIRTTQGLRCKACNSPLASVEFDGELCDTCLVVVHKLNRALYELEDADVELVIDELE